MNSKCDKYQKMIPDFFEDELEEGDLSEFLDHIASCKTCRDELSFQYLLYDGLSMLESGASFDLEKEVNNETEAARKRLIRRQRAVLVAAALEIITLATALVTGYVYITRMLL